MIKYLGDISILGLFFSVLTDVAISTVYSIGKGQFSFKDTISAFTNFPVIDVLGNLLDSTFRDTKDLIDGDVGGPEDFYYRTLKTITGLKYIRGSALKVKEGIEEKSLKEGMLYTEPKRTPNNKSSKKGEFDNLNELGDLNGLKNIEGLNDLGNLDKLK